MIREYAIVVLIAEVIPRVSFSCENILAYLNVVACLVARIIVICDERFKVLNFVFNRYGRPWRLPYMVATFGTFFDTCLPPGAMNPAASHDAASLALGNLAILY